MLSATTTMSATLTGVKDIAEIFGAGISGGSLVIIEGESKSGKSVLTQYLAHGVLHSRENAIAYYTTGNADSDLIAQMDSMSLDARHYLVTDRLRTYPLSSPIGPGAAQSSGKRLINQILELPARFNFIVVDAITSFMIHISPSAKMDLLLAFKELCKQGRSIILVADTHVFENGTLLRAYLMSDYYLRLRSEETMLWAGQMDDRVIKILEALKLRGVERQTGEHIKFEIKPKVGIQILPFVKVKI